MAISVSERIAQVAEHFARHDAHGYSQPNRGKGSLEEVTLSDGSKVKVTNRDVDCSEMVRQCVNCALGGQSATPIVYMWTGDEDEKLKAQGFKRMAYDPGTVRRGDVLWVKGHTGVALGGGMQADAHGDEYGGITGPTKGDQTGHEVERRSLRSWTYIYRYAGGAQLPTFVPASFDLEFKGSCNIRKEPSMRVEARTGKRWEAGETARCDGLCMADGHIWATYVGNSGNRRYVSLGEAHDWLCIR